MIRKSVACWLELILQRLLKPDVFSNLIKPLTRVKPPNHLRNDCDFITFVKRRDAQGQTQSKAQGKDQVQEVYHARGSQYIPKEVRKVLGVEDDS